MVKKEWKNYVYQIKYFETTFVISSNAFLKMFVTPTSLAWITNNLICHVKWFQLFCIEIEQSYLYTLVVSFYHIIVCLPALCLPTPMVYLLFAVHLFPPLRMLSLIWKKIMKMLSLIYAVNLMLSNFRVNYIIWLANNGLILQK